MNGGDVHELMLDDLAQRFEDVGVAVSRQAPSCPGRHTGYVDLLVHLDKTTLAIEVEMSSRRAENDIQKARELGAGLWIVVPNCRVATSIRRRLRQLGSRRKKDALVLTVGQARNRVRAFVAGSRRSVADLKTNTSSTKQMPAAPKAVIHATRADRPQTGGTIPCPCTGRT
jgi:hypothetical protein